MGQGRGWGKNVIDNPYVAVHQLKTHMFLLIITHTAHEKMGYFPRSKSMEVCHLLSSRICQGWRLAVPRDS